ncbi:MAG: hypothetical protein Q7K38_03590, partial [Candidatus Wildermuthbacteria bacterium]|nr:hypothetical protein [Candidatus Wildermuthbacteria bacterium]
MQKSKVQLKVEKLRGTYPRFFYRAYSYKREKKGLVVTFYFEAPPDISFHPKVVISNIPNTLNIPKPYLDNLVFHLGLMEIPSYWKATCSPEIIIEAGSLNKEQIAWWKDLILKGMGE